MKNIVDLLFTHSLFYCYSSNFNLTWHICETSYCSWWQSLRNA